MYRKLWKQLFIISVICCIVLSGMAFASGIEYSDRDTVVAVQEELNKAGYNCGTPDGVMGGRTADAIRNYQKAHSLTVTGTITEELLAALGIAESAGTAKNETVQESAEELQEESSNSASFAPFLMNTTEKSAEEWLTGEYMRAMATATIAIDLSLTDDVTSEEIVFAVAKTSYIGRAGSDLLVYLHGNERDILLLYNPDSKKAFYQFMDVTDDSILQITLNAAFTDGCYQNNSETVLSVLRLMAQALGQD